MTGQWNKRRTFRHRILLTAAVAALIVGVIPARATVVISDGFGDADRNNDGVIGLYDADINNSGTLNDPNDLEDQELAARGIIEVTAPLDANDIGIIWSGIRSFDTTANIPKATLRIINDTIATGTETASEIHDDGLALGVESRGGGSSFIGRFPEAIELGEDAGDRLVVSVDFRVWREAGNPFEPPALNELRWGLYEDTDDELGMTGPYGDGAVSAPPGAIVEWGKDDGNWFAQQPGAEGDKGIRAQLTFGSVASALDSRINWEYNLAGINGTSNNGRILEGNGVSDAPASGGDTGTIANPTNPEDGPGGIIMGGTYAPHTLSMEIIRLENGLIEIASFVDGVEALRDDIKESDTGFSVLGPPAFTYDYVVFRNTADFDYAIDNFKVELFDSSPGLAGDYNNDGSVDAADYVVWRKNNINGQQGYNDWRTNFGATAGPANGLSSAAVPEPTGVAVLVFGGFLLGRIRWRNSCLTGE
jgi:hypothetical protein